MKPFLNDSWWAVMKSEFEQPYYQELREWVKEEYRTQIVFPKPDDIYRALHLTSYEAVKVVILGQDPYHGPGQAHGLSFSVQLGVKHPPSLRNIFQELKDDLGCPVPNHGSLVSWAEQGVLLLNTVLTVRKGEANSHKGKGWERVTDRVIDVLNDRDQPVVFVLWGRHAQNKKERIDQSKHYIIESPHPSPFSARNGFFGSRPFSKVNAYLKQMGIDEINWCIKDIESK
ncbi:uracil-DNA glycosylase [Bacillus altitudinis]|uniref:uracil-DNA glycosylase n=1 Tax=Bacillus TaxID=1386 RepID=UPI0007065064|nr:uracil-DNA glycosylase [Bacillus altitudinis]ALM27507.1 uracil-DNA glycosylase [Bacillus altitudinis]ALM44050.1 uracil-DNA glycosylase [Bacillus altitudinis]ANY95522.1 uracil-DNA glycosylase [Bacillus altitudinis]MDI6645685.1 uracil-DNA glycosylase [Bacillus altitudinis]MDI6660354.1 uracil-DNA glycosylase [Bacillus altitudinis]